MPDNVQLYCFRRRIHPNTVRNLLRSAGLKARRPLRSATLTMQHRRRRLQWARQHIRLHRRQCLLTNVALNCLVQMADDVFGVGGMNVIVIIVFWHTTGGRRFSAFLGGYLSTEQDTACCTQSQCEC